ncbi:uncharacterized protein LOC131006583 [Salvia miltiorrhiza]|uniref:uncharacterized protein LOC131006583 n=1 Tax=Salvia miltiorrhiza TaxID=226208 RepID=UPI0025AD514C|nr:uncharacterized protein LOC131006583 [Salvia miltiorrhiza]
MSKTVFGEGGDPGSNDRMNRDVEPSKKTKSKRARVSSDGRSTDIPVPVVAPVTEDERCEAAIAANESVEVEDVTEPNDGNKDDGGGDGFLVLHTRTTPSSFSSTMSKLNQNQKNAVIEMGFGHLLELNVRALPTKMAYWLLENFDHETGNLVIDDNVQIKVTEDDVYRVFGFPRGTEKINRFVYSACNALSLRWVQKFNVYNREHIKIKVVLAKMLADTDGGVWFRRHFIVALQFSLIESYPNGMVHPFVMRCLEDLGKIQNWNWGEYVVQSLLHHKESWIDNEKHIFCGPVLFLVLLYVDGMEIDGFDKGRSYPILVNWNGTDLRKRQKIEVDSKIFGSGSLRGPIPLPQAEIIGSSNLCVSPSVAVVESSESSLQSRMLKISREISEKAKILKAMLEEASNEERASLLFRECVLRCANISGVPLALNYDGSSDIVRRTGEGTRSTDCGQVHEKGSPLGEDTAVDDVDSEDTMSAELDTELTAREDNDDEFTSDEETDEVLKVFN